MDKKKQKEKLRQSLLERRSSIPEKTYLEQSSRILSRLKKLKVYQQAEVVHCYVSMNERREVNTHPLIKEMIGAGKKVVVPVTQMESGMLKHMKLQSFDNLEANEWGVLEPVNQKEVGVGELNLVIVPMAGGDEQKNRIGYGKGFYDRFLSQVNCPAIGLLFESCLCESIPTEPFDVPLDTLITEEQIIH